MTPFSFSTRSLHLLSPRGAPCLAAPVWQCMLPPGGSASLHDAADCKWLPQGAGEDPEEWKGARRRQLRAGSPGN